MTIRKIAARGCRVLCMLLATAGAVLPVAAQSADRAALIALYNATNGPSWTIKSGWDTAIVGTECTWYGVTCDGSQRVTHLVLDDNQLTGSIPAELGQLTNLYRLRLNSNQLSGRVPGQLGRQLTNLEELHLSSNQLVGELPETLWELSAVKVLELSYNALWAGDWLVRSWADARQPGWDALQTVAPSIAAATAQSSYSIVVSWAPIPYTFGSGRYEVQQYSPPEGPFVTVATTASKSASSATISGLAANTTYYFRIRTISDPNTDNPGNQVVSEFGSAVSGTTAGADRAALLAFYNATNGPRWMTKSGWDTAVAGTECSWYGVFCDESQRVAHLSLEGNQLSGSIPPEIGQLTNLSTLYLAGNQLTGSLPPELGQLSKLSELRLYSNYLTGSIPPQLGQLANLRQLRLEDNYLTGSIPPELGQLANLDYLFLHSNQLSGSIPPELGQLANLNYLFLYSNQLSGSIPPELGQIAYLYRLRMDANQLTGSIPAELGQLTNLNVLHLSSNQLAGPLPLGLSALSTVGELRLNYNALYATDPSVKSWADARQPGWDATQTVAPSNPAATAQTASSILVSWTPIAYSFGSGGYEVQQASSAGGPFATALTTASKSDSSATISGLTANTTYSFRIRTISDPNANNPANQVVSEFGPVVSGTTAGISCAAPPVNGFAIGFSGPVSGCSASGGSCHPGEAVQFNVQTSYSYQTCDTLSWNFGDGTGGTGAAPTHAYSAPGTYTATFTVTNSSGTATATRQITVEAPCGAPPANAFSIGYSGPFSGCTASGGSCHMGESVRFSADASGYSYQACDTVSWQFGDGATATGVNPAHTFAAPGTYDVTFTVSNIRGTASATRQVTVIDPGCVGAPRDAAVTYRGGTSACRPGTSCSVGEPIEFSLLSASYWFQPCDLYHWQMGDGTTRDLGSFVYSYKSPGTYAVTVQVNNPHGTTTATATVVIAGENANPLIHSFTATPTFVTAGQSASLSWSFAGASNGTLEACPGGSTCAVLSAVGPSGTEVVTPSVTTIYKLKAGTGSAVAISLATVQVGQATTATVGTLAGTGVPGSTDGPVGIAQFSAPTSVAMDPTTGDTIIVDGANQTIRRLTRGTAQTIAGSPGQFGSADGVGASARFNFGSGGGVTVDSGGTIYIADTGNHTIRKITPDGTVTTLAGKAGASGASNGSGTGASFNEPTNVTTDAAGNVYVADTRNHIIRKVTPQGDVSTVAGDPNVPGNANGPGTGGGTLGTPSGVAAGGDGSIFITDPQNGNIRKLGPDGMLTTVVGPGTTGTTNPQVSAPIAVGGGITVTPEGTLFVTSPDAHTIVKVKPRAPGGMQQPPETVGGRPGAPGNSDGTGEDARFKNPSDIAVNEDGNLIIADRGNNTIREAVPPTDTASTPVRRRPVSIGGGR